MKRLPRLHAEPPGLAAYRSANPVDANANGADAHAVWKRFRDSAAYNELRTRLVEAQGALCAYCEQRLTNESGELHILDQQVEHVLAKSGASGRTLDWTNLVLCCTGGTNPHLRDVSRRRAGTDSDSCGQRKGDQEAPPSCDPRSFPCSPPLVDVGLNGEIRPNQAACHAHGVDPAELGVTINTVLNLNCERLRTSRAKVVDHLLQWVVPLLGEMLEGTHLTALQVAELRDLQVAGRLQRDAHGHLRAFWTTERQYLEPASSTWISKNEPTVCG